MINHRTAVARRGQGGSTTSPEEPLIPVEPAVISEPAIISEPADE
jgi:hypothetical protein